MTATRRRYRVALILEEVDYHREEGVWVEDSGTRLVEIDLDTRQSLEDADCTFKTVREVIHRKRPIEPADVSVWPAFISKKGGRGKSPRVRAGIGLPLAQKRSAAQINDAVASMADAGRFCPR